MKKILKYLLIIITIVFIFCILALWCIYLVLRDDPIDYKAKRSPEEMDYTIKHWFGEISERVTIIPSDVINADYDVYIYKLSSIHENAEPFYIAAKNNYHIDNNFFIQLLKSDAVNFWGEKSRNAMLVTEDGSTETELSETINDLDHAQDNTDWRLRVYCESQNDFLACAQDLDDWFNYCMQDSRIYRDDSSYAPNRALLTTHPLLKIEIAIDDTLFWLEMSVYDISNKGDEETHCSSLIASKLEEAYKKRINPYSNTIY